jgi:hypothetical protein
MAYKRQIVKRVLPDMNHLLCREIYARSKIFTLAQAIRPNGGIIIRKVAMIKEAVVRKLSPGRVRDETGT